MEGPDKKEEPNTRTAEEYLEGKKGETINMSKEEKERNEVLERFMKEFFPFNELKKVGFFSKEMKGDYKAQSERVCKFFGYETVYQYGAKEIRCHISYAGKRQPDEPFVTVIPSIYE